MKKLVLTVIITLLCLNYNNLFSSEILNLNYDFNSFKSNDDSTYVEFTFAFSQDNIFFIKKDSSYISGLSISLMLTNEKDTILQNWDIQINALELGEKKGKLFIGAKQFKAMPGKYNATVKLTDLNKSVNTEIKESIVQIKKYDKLDIDISDIMLAYSIEKVANMQYALNPNFVKSDLYIIPNPNNELYGIEPLLISYSEIYNNFAEQYDSLVIRYNVSNSMKYKVEEIIRVKQNSSSAFYEINQILLDTLASGLYYLDVTVNGMYDNKVKSTSSVTKKFYLMNPQRNPQLTTYFTEDEIFARSEFASLTDEQCEEEYRQVIVIASKNEQEIWSKLQDYTAKRKYLYAFWNNRKSDKTIFLNTERMEYKKLIDYANHHFSVGGAQEGWKTDRGRILLKYGKPSNVDSYTAKDGNKPYEEWSYEALSGGVKFFFVDVRLNGRYSLVHSTLFEEVQNSDWENMYLKQTK